MHTMPPMAIGPLLKEALLTLWRGVVDSTYARAFLEAGEGKGYEVYTQAAAQLEKVAIENNRSLQANYILPSSQQTAPPASGARRATVDLTITRANTNASIALIITPDVVFEEEATDYSEDGPIGVLTGRRYRPTQTVVLGPGQLGPLTVPCEAVRSGYGSNHALPGQIKRFVQTGNDLANDRATLAPATTSHALIAQPDPDVPASEHVGRYVFLVDGANVGAMRRVTGYSGPNPDASPPNGGTLYLAPTAVWTVANASNTFQPGEPTRTAGGAETVVWYADNERVVFERISGTLVPGDELEGLITGATVELLAEEQAADLLPETNTAAWRILDWEVDLGLSVTNALSPEGGATAMLDDIGWERKVFRANGEDDDTYRYRVATPGDVVSPDAIRRIVNRIMTPLGHTATVHEVGQGLFSGLYADGDPSSNDYAIAFAFDIDDTNPEDRFKLALDYTQFRAFFLIEVPRMGLGEFGCAYDGGDANAYDAEACADGFAAGDAEIYGAIWQAVDRARAYGVGFELVLAPPA